MARIFISYKRVDKDRVFKIKDQIESALGEKCWIDLDGIESDAVFASKIIGAINNCEVFLFMYSNAHKRITDYENDWTIRELNFAQMQKKRIVFINIDGSELTDWFKLLFGTKQQVDGLSPQSLSRLNSDIKGWLGIKDLSVHPPHLDTEEALMGQFKECKINKSFLARNKKSCIFSVSVLLVLCVAFILPIIFGNSSDNRIESTPSAAAKTDSSTQTHKGLEAIDLALPSGTLWANKNVGAKSEYDFGELYSWGEVSEKGNYAQNHYKTIGVRNIAGTQYDVATQLYGLDWQIPSPEDFQELIDNCQWSWESKNDVNGIAITGSNGNSIFLPASGWSCSSTIEHRNKYGYYWTSTKRDEQFAIGLLFPRDKMLGNGYLYYGRSIRAVKK